MAKDSAKDDIKDILLSMVDVQISQIEHYQVQRSTVSNLLVITSAALLAFVTFDKSLNSSDLPLTILLALLGPFGFAFCTKYRERNDMHHALYKSYIAKIDELVLDSTLLSDIKKKVDEKHADDYPRMKKGYLKRMRISNLWRVFHVLIFILGVFLSFLAYYRPVNQTEVQPMIVAPTPSPVISAR